MKRAMAMACLATLLIGAQWEGAGTAQAEARPLSVAVLPAQYFSADRESAARFTEGIRKVFAEHGWRVLPAETVVAAWRQLGLKNGVHYADPRVFALGRRLRADRVVYPRLLALGTPLATNQPAQPVVAGQAVVHVRVLDPRVNGVVYFNQVGENYGHGEAVALGKIQLPSSIADAAASRVLARYFQGTRSSGR